MLLRRNWFIAWLVTTLVFVVVPPIFLLAGDGEGPLAIAAFIMAGVATLCTAYFIWVLGLWWGIAFALYGTGAERAGETQAAIAVLVVFIALLITHAVTIAFFMWAYAWFAQATTGVISRRKARRSAQKAQPPTP